MSDPSSPAESPRARSRRGKVLIRLALIAVCAYLGVAVLLTVFQRKLIYLPWRSESVPVAEAGLPAGRVHEFTFRTADGLTLHGWHLLAGERTCRTPSECDAELAAGRPVVLFFHGNGGDRRLRVDDCRLLTAADADVLLIDYRGYGENPGSPSEAGLMQDARGLWHYATRARDIAPGRIVLFGESLGGGVAAALCAELCTDGTPPAGLILRSTFSSLVDAAAYHYPWLPVDWLLTDRFASADVMGRITCPLLQIHGTADRVVPLASGRQLFDAAPAESANGIAKRFVELPGADHNDVLRVARQPMSAAIAQFLATVRIDRSSK